MTGEAIECRDSGRGFAETSSPNEYKPSVPRERLAAAVPHRPHDETGASIDADAAYVADALKAAAALVNGARNDAYGHPADVYGRVGRVWGAILGVPDIPAATVTLMLAGMKVARHAQRPNADNIVDVAGYAQCTMRAERRARGLE